MKVIDRLRRVHRVANFPRIYIFAGFVAGFLIAAGCSQNATKPKTSGSNPNNEFDGSKFLLTSEPTGAADVIKVRESAKDSDEVVIVGRIGGSADPWVEGRVAFTIVDLSLKSCLECGSGGCPKPWDYC